MIELTQDGPDVLIPVKVVPGASRDRVAGELDGALKITVSAAAEKGAANKAVCKLIARTLGVRAKDVTIDSGQTNPRKIIRVAGVTVDTLRDTLSSI